MDHQQLIDQLITVLMQEGGSDLHLSMDRYPAIRVTGQLIFLVRQAVLTKDDVMGMLKAMLGDVKYAKFLETEEMDFAYDFQSAKARLRGNAYMQKGKVAVALRLIPNVKTLADLHLPDMLATFARKKQGFFLIVGPVGQGKSTTMAAMVNLINEERSEHIVTIEDPIEYIFEPKHSIIDQREVGIDTKNFETALKSIFREDVNVIMVGEMRNHETIGTAVTAAETGHFVLSTLHTNNASQTIDRIIDAFPPEAQDQIRSQLSNSLIGIFSQRLIPRIAGGLIPAYELLINNNAVSNLIREKRTHEIDVVIETGFEQGMVDMNRCLVDLVRAGEISMDNAYLYSINPKALERLL
jgi:twitching motility protein PilT